MLFDSDNNACCLIQVIVKAIDLICDQGSNNQSKLEASVSKPHFMHNNNHIIIFYDPPHFFE